MLSALKTKSLSGKGKLKNTVNKKFFPIPYGTGVGIPQDSTVIFLTSISDNFIVIPGDQLKVQT